MTKSNNLHLSDRAGLVAWLEQHRIVDAAAGCWLWTGASVRRRWAQFRPAPVPLAHVGEAPAYHIPF